ncbi:FAD-dependent monooxygenase [Streptomyces zaomyceticus]|uniref:FAD-dependent monooxygenase n=1 Tax=Streptomyces zaomyceticus TaxID=68286 RepID=UPI0036B56BDD
MSDVQSVLIVGGGIAGLAAARALEQRGMSADIIERRTQPPAGMGLFLPGNAVRSLAELGLETGLNGLGTPIRTQRLRDSRAGTLAEIDLLSLWSKAGPSLGTTHTRLHSLMSRAVKATVRTGVTVSSFTEDTHGVHVEFSDGRRGDYDLLVGADGIRSQLRDCVSPETEPRFAGQVCWRFLTENLPGIDRWTAWLGNGATFLALPVGDSRLYCYADLSISAAENGTTEGSQLAESFADFDPVVTRLLATADARSAYFSLIEDVTPERWTTARTVLVGDAAHATSPNMAQGVGMAVEDALVLAECLDRPGSLSERLDSYVTRRMPRTAWVQRHARKRDRARGLPRGVRNLVLRVGAKHMYTSAYGPLNELP